MKLISSLKRIEQEWQVQVDFLTAQSVGLNLSLIRNSSHSQVHNLTSKLEYLKGASKLRMEQSLRSLHWPLMVRWVLFFFKISIAHGWIQRKLY